MKQCRVESNALQLSSLNAGLSCSTCFEQDDASGRQQFTLVEATGGFTIQVINGRRGCPTYVSALNCSAGGGLTFTSFVDASGLALWNVGASSPSPPSLPPPPPPPGTAQYFANGDYQIVNLGRSPCAPYLSAPPCATSNNVLMGGGGIISLHTLGAKLPSHILAEAKEKAQVLQILLAVNACQRGSIQAPK